MEKEKNMSGNDTGELSTEKYNPALEGMSVGDPCTDIPIGLAENKGTFAGLARKNNAAGPGPVPTPHSPGNAAATGDPSRSPKRKRRPARHRYQAEPPLPGPTEDILVETGGTAVPEPQAIPAVPPVVSPGHILIGLPSESKNAAIARAGEQLVSGGYVRPAYIASMMMRETTAPSYSGESIAIVQGTEEGWKEVLHPGIVVLQYPEGVMFGGERAHLVIGIAAPEESRPEVAARIRTLFEDKKLPEELKTTPDKRLIYERML